MIKIPDKWLRRLLSRPIRFNSTKRIKAEQLGKSVLVYKGEKDAERE